MPWLTTSHRQAGNHKCNSNSHATQHVPAQLIQYGSPPNPAHEPPAHCSAHSLRPGPCESWAAHDCGSRAAGRRIRGGVAPDRRLGRRGLVSPRLPTGAPHNAPPGAQPRLDLDTGGCQGKATPREGVHRGPSRHRVGRMKQQPHLRGAACLHPTGARWLFRLRGSARRGVPVLGLARSVARAGA
eukprot:scaffold18608_cov97-Isochrysis_galbana.AAC.4